MAKYAIVATAGRQYRLEEGRYVDLDLIDAKDGDSINFDNHVLLLSIDGKITVGTPTVAGAKVSGKVVKSGRRRKILVYKMRPKKHYRRKNGHRQPFTRVMIEKIEA